MSESYEKPGLFKRARQAVQDAYAEDREKRRAAAETERAFYEKAAEKYGRLVESAIFDHRRIEIFDGGFVRVGGTYNIKGGPLRELGSSDYVVAYDAPFERLRAIKANSQIQDKSAGGRAMASAASLGLSQMASNEKRLLFLTISTDRETYSLKEKAGMLRLADQIPMRLELAGQGILDSLAATPTATPSSAETAPAPVTEQLKDLAALHRDGVLSDHEFADAKARLLGRL